MSMRIPRKPKHLRPPYWAPRCVWCGDVAVALVWTPDGWQWRSEDLDDEFRTWHIGCVAEALDERPDLRLEQVEACHG
jgi:hypothetical protein